MPTATPQDLTYTADTIYPPNTMIGYLILLSGKLLLGEVAATNSTTDAVTTTNPHGLAIGSRIRFGGTLPIDLLGTQDYFAVPTGANTFQVAQSLAGAQALPPVVIDLTITTTTLLVNEQLLLASDPINVLINKELPAANGYQRLAIAGLAPAVITSPTTADHPPLTLSITNTGATDMTHRYEVAAKGGTAIAGDTTGILSIDVLTQAVDQITAPNQTRDFVITLGAIAPV
jgi:hypothetical protein